MSRSSFAVAALLVAPLLVAGLGASAAADSGKRVAREALRWSSKLPAGQTVHLRNVNGTVKVTRGAGDAVEVVATENKHEGDPAQVTVQVVKVKDGFMVCVLYPDLGRGDRAGRCDADGTYKAGGHGGHDLGADLTVKLPAGVAVDARTVNGEVTVAGATAKVSASTVNGPVSVDSTGTPVSVETVNGDVSVRAGSGNIAAQTVNGSIEITLPAGISAQLAAQTVHGSLDNDFGLRAQGDHAGRELHGTLGKGTYAIAAETVNGSIRFRKQ